jgi:hypothetical protein
VRVRIKNMMDKLEIILENLNIYRRPYEIEIFKKENPYNKE